MSEGQLIRRLLPFERNYTTIPNAWVRDERLTFKARGIRDLLLSHEHGWKITLKKLASSSPDGLAAIRTGVEELEKFGYLIRRPTRRGMADDWELCDPSSLSEPSLLAYSDVREPVDNSRSKIARENHAFENRTRHACENRTLIEDQLRNKQLPEATTEAPVDKCPRGHELIEGRCALACAADLERREALAGVSS